MARAKKVTVSRGIISSIDFDNGLVEVRNPSGSTRYTILPENLFDTDGAIISIEELRPGDHVFISETDYVAVMKVLKAV
ncbi:hypothetical protein [Desulfotomaculum nigrificans]|uniref:hypothetical protein n=1 Tax=Desulfotomaculum nigrificans TaxID=1565 RepID=UPI0001FAE76E|nr:hypothetical protein [Desulfotomaculum nigrificans]MDA8235916.1 hypothetical protein [Clostridia bacterium]